jgi:glutamate/tyrosine decarboxylase-like PLP-dependent enzyme
MSANPASPAACRSAEPPAIGRVNPPTRIPASSDPADLAIAAEAEAASTRASNAGQYVDRLFKHAARLAIGHRSSDATPRPTAAASELRALFDIPLPDNGRDGVDVIDRLAEAARPGLVGNTGPDFFGWVMGASHPVGIAADWLTAAWGQNAAIYATAPAAAIAEEVVSRWLVDLLRLPPESSVGFATGATMASFTCLAAARSEVLRRVGYDLETDGLIGAPPISVFVGEEAHTTIFSGLRYLGFGRKNLVEIGSDGAGRMLAGELERKLDRHEGPRIVIGQAGHINSGAFDRFPELVELTKAHNAWLHVDGAFGLWARAVPELDQLSTGVEAADSWAVDGHKWLQVPYDSGFAIVRDKLAHKRAMDTSASYIAEKSGDGRNPTQYGPELSRRARGFAAWAVIQALGRNGIADLVRGHCRLARHLETTLAAEPGITVMNEVALNQLAIVFEDARSPVDADTLTKRVVVEIQKENTSFVEQAVWKGRRILRVSIISGDTRQAHVDRLAASIIRAWRQVKAEPATG